MPVSWRNRKGLTYYLHEGRTSKGNPKYFFSKKSEGNLIEAVPAGYEVYEKPDTAQVYLRKPQPSRVTSAERDFVLQECRKATGTDAVLADVEGDTLIVYFAEGDNSALEILCGEIGLGSRAIAGMKEWRVSRGHYEKVLRFTLVDDAQRLYSADRWCFRGMGHWTPLARSAPLDRLVREYAPHLGEESYFELGLYT